MKNIKVEFSERELKELLFIVETFIDERVLFDVQLDYDLLKKLKSVLYGD